MPNRPICSSNFRVELLYGEVGGAELEKLEQTSPKQALKKVANSTDAPVKISEQLTESSPKQALRKVANSNAPIQNCSLVTSSFYFLGPTRTSMALLGGLVEFFFHFFSSRTYTS